MPVCLCLFYFFRHIKDRGSSKEKVVRCSWKLEQSISNHLYWCAASSHGDGEQVKAKWLSILNHVTNIHEGHSETFPECAHGHLEEERKWLRRGNATQE